MNFPKSQVFFLVILLSFLSSHAQNTKRQIDSLRRVALSAPDSLKFDIYNRMAFHYIFNDSITADSILTSALREAKSRKNSYGEVLLLNTKGIQFDVHGVYDSAYFYFDEALTLSRKRNYAVLEGRALNNLGMNAWNSGRLSTAQEYFFQGLELIQLKFPEKRTDHFLNNIGLIYQELEELDKALVYHKKALQERQDKGLPVAQIASYNNIGICNRILGNYEESLKAFETGLALSEEVGAYQEYQRLHTNRGNVYLDLKDYGSAIKAFENGKAANPEGTQDKKDAFLSSSGMGYAYLLSGNVLKAENELEYAQALLDENLEYRLNAETFYKVMSAVALARSENARGFKYIDSLQFITKERFSDANATALAHAETRFQTAEKEVALAQTRAALVEKELDLRRRNNMIFGVGGLALVLGLLGYLFYNQQRLKNRQLQRESELQTALAKIETQNRLQEQRLRISRDLHDNIGSQLTFITSTIDTLKYGLKEARPAITSKLDALGSFTKTTINELRDTIWAMNKESMTLEDIVGRIGNLLEQARKSSPTINFQFEVSADVDLNSHLTAIEGVNLYRIIQEAVNNAMKYTEDATIKIGITQYVNTLAAQIEDTGSGFDIGQISSGNGLRNMKKRSQDIGGTLDIKSSAAGTQVVFELPMNK